MSKTSLRSQIDLEMKDVKLSPERIRRIHSQTDGKRSHSRTRFRRLPAAVLSLALVACAALAFINRGSMLEALGRYANTNQPGPLSGGIDGTDTGPSGEADSIGMETAAPLPTALPTEAPRELSFVAAGVTFMLEGAAAEADMLTLNWRVASERDDQVCFAFYDFRVDGCGCHATPEALGGLTGLTALDGAVEGVPLPTERNYGASIPIASSGEALTVRMTMAVYAFAAEPRLEISSPDSLLAPTPEPQAIKAASDSSVSDTDEMLEQLREKMMLTLAAGERENAQALLEEMRYIYCVDALEDGKIMFTEEGEISAVFPEALKKEITYDRDWYDSLPVARASLALAEQCGLIKPLGEVEIEVEVEVRPAQ